jgi:Ulp1 family protease
LDDRKVDSFEAEYAGIVTNNILKRLRENEWLDNSITSAVIEYLKQVEGANNYHNDSNFMVCLFTHSETDIFVNSQRDADDYLNYEKLIFLVNIPNTHWFVITVYTKRNEIVVYDSLNNYTDAHKDYCDKILKKLKKKRPEAEFKQIYFYSPKQNNASDCGVFSIINIICAFDKGEETQVKNNFQASIIS